MERPHVIGTAGDPRRGNFLVLYLRFEGERVGAASFQCHGCAPAIAAGSLLAKRLEGSTLTEAAGWDAARIEAELGGLPRSKRHCAALAAEALRDALARRSSTQSS